MLNVVSLSFRDRFPDCYVDRLYSMVRRNLSAPFRFFCVTDRHRDLHPDVVQIQCPDVGEGRGSRNKLRLFDFAWSPFDSLLYLDISLVVKRPLDDLKGALESVTTPLDSF